ncbi:hypothetical protein OPIT5_01460 [Opitutaceae bacterium TAV5]|nr:hypothetical protein OPIT5_01460 [Opitutaceae bacterium TAV5]
MPSSIHFLITACLLFATSAFAAGTPDQPVDKTLISAHANQTIGRINHNLAGVSLGGGATTYLNPVYTRPLAEAGVRYVRLETVTADHRKLYDPATRTWNWSQLDAEIEAIRAGGADIVANIFYTPRFLAFHDDDRYFYSYPKDYAAWETWVEAIVRHVNIEKKYGIRYWEIGNEASGAHFFRAPMRDFWKYYESSARAVKRADPAALVGGIADNPNYPELYGDFFNAAKRSGTPVDFVSFHWYASWARKGDTSPDLYFRFARSLKELSRHRLGRDVPLFLTEWNCVGERPAEPRVKVGAYVGAAFYWMQESPIDAAFLFRVQPYRDTLGSLYNAKGETGMVGRIFRMFSGLPEERINLVTVAPGVTGLAARSGNDRIAILLARFDPDRGNVVVDNTLAIPGHGLTGRYRLTLHLEDAATADTYGERQPVEDRVLTLTPATPVRVNLQLSNYSVAFLRLEKVDGK